VGKVLFDPLDSTQTTPLANLNALGSHIAAFATVANDDWRGRFLKATTLTGGATPMNTLEAMASIAHASWADPTTLYGLFDEAYPQAKDGSRRKAPFLPYLTYAPSDSPSCSVSQAAGCSRMASRAASAGQRPIDSPSYATARATVV
jgi:hypothetical protein